MSATSATAVPRDRVAVLNLVLLGVLLVVVVIHAGGFLLDGALAIGTPVELDYGEGIVWQQAALLAGPRMYQASSALPFIVFHYPPLFHLVARAAQAVLPDPLAAGRLVAVASTLAVVPMLGGLILLATPSGVRWRVSSVLAVVAASLLLLGMAPVRNWGVLMRVDMLGLAFGCAGLVVASWAGGRFGGTLLALLLCLAAVFTKQTMLSFGVAVFLLSLVRRPGATMAAAAIVGAIGVGAVLVLQHLTGGGFLDNIVGYNINRFSLRVAFWVMLSQGPNLLLFGAMLWAAAWLLMQLVPTARPRDIWRHLRGLGTTDLVTWRRGLVVMEVVLSCVVLLTLFKVGGYMNYLLELCCAGCVAAGVVMVALTGRGGAHQRALAVLLAVLLAGIDLQPSRTWAGIAPPERVAVDTELVARIRDAALPVASENMVLLMQSGKGVVYEPAIVTELAHVGRWDEAPLVAMIRNHGFAFMLTVEGGAEATNRRTEAVNAAMQAAYPRLRQLRPGLWLHE